MSRLSVRLSGQILSPRYLTNGLTGKYSLAPTGDLIEFWRSKVKVTPGQSMWWQRQECRHWGVEVHLLVLKTRCSDKICFMPLTFIFKKHSHGPWRPSKSPPVLLFWLPYNVNPESGAVVILCMSGPGIGDCGSWASDGSRQ